MSFDLYLWKAPRDMDAVAAGALVDGWLASGGDPRLSPFDPSSDTGWAARELDRDAPGVELVTDSPRWEARGPIWLQTEPAPPARVVAIRLRPAVTGEDLEQVLGVATKYDLVLYEPRHARVVQPLDALAAHASATFWPGGAVRAAVAGTIGLVIAIAGWFIAVPVLTAVLVVVGGFLASMSVYAVVHALRERFTDHVRETPG